MHELSHRTWGCDNSKSFGFGGRERSYQTEIGNMVGRFSGAMAHHRLISMVRTVEHAANHGASGFTSHAAGEQRHRNRQEGEEDDASFDALHA